MESKPKDGAQRRRPASTRLRRAQQTDPLSILKCATASPTLKRDDVASARFSFELGVGLLMRDQSCSQQSLDGLARLFLNVLSTGDLLGFIEACSQMRAVLVQTGSWERGISKFPKLRWVRGIRSAFEHAVDCSLIVHPSRHFDAIVTFLGWLKRLPVCIRDANCAVDAYLECDARVSSVDFDDNVYVPCLRDIWVEWFGDFQISNPFNPKHGSGSTADVGKVRHDKWRSLQHDRRAHVCLHNAQLEKVLTTRLGEPSRVSKVVFVPKQAGKDRTICMEPAWLQFLQQGVARQLIAFTHRTNHPLSRIVDIFSQEKNRSLCAQAYSKGLATIDLSDASDSVSWRLIERLTDRLPLKGYLFATRSVTTRINGIMYEMDKYAPMGSALCFPIECFVFASIVELAYRIHYGQASDGYLSGCSVYGDDIICPSEIYHLVVDILTSLGFLVNESKSFDSGPYYESCGVEYLYGAKINTIKHPRNHIFSQDVVSPERVGLITDLTNSLGDAGYFLARRCLLKRYEKSNVRVGNRTLPFMDLMKFDEEHCVPVQTPYCETTWSDALQCGICKYWSVETNLSRTPSDWLEYITNQPVRSREQRLLDARRTPKRPKMHEKWSLKAITMLSRTQWWDLLETGDIPLAGQHRAGRPRQQARKRFVPAGLLPKR